MGRAKRALAAAAILGALAAASIAAAPRAAAEGGELAGELPVAGGVALVSWSGSPAGALAGAARSRGCNVRSIHEANSLAANAAFLDTHPTGSPASSSVFLVTCGEPIPPRIVFLGDIDDYRRAQIREDVASVVRFYAERFGAAVGDSTLYVSPDSEAVAAVHRELTGREYPLSADEEGGTATYTLQDGALGFIGGRFVNEWPPGFASVLAHEYYHMIQHAILHAGGGSYAAPAWIVEGTATYGEILYLEAHEGEAYWGEVDWGISARGRLPQAVQFYGSTPFREVAESFRSEHYDLAAQAVGWLVDGAGNTRAHLDFWRSLTRTADWQEAFAAEFGITPEASLPSFDQYRRDIRASFPSISGVVTDLEGERLGGVQVAAEADQGILASSRTGADGAFTMRVPEGAYVLRLWSRYELPGVGIYTLGYNPKKGYANVCDYAPLVVVGEAGVANVFMAILPELLERSDRPVCNEGRPGFHLISGFIRDHEGNPIEDDHYRSRRIFIFPEEAYTSGRLITGARISGGKFEVAVLDGQYVLSIGAEAEPGAEVGGGGGWYGDDGGITTKKREVRIIDVNGSDVTGIEVFIPSGFLELPSVQGWDTSYLFDTPERYLVSYPDVFSGVHPVSGH